jgi:hypothetical protein
MTAAEYCQSCNEAILWKCSSCQKENDRSIHTVHPQSEELSARSVSLVSTALGVMSGLYMFMPA